MATGRRARAIATALIVAVAVGAAGAESARQARALTLDADPATRRLCGWISANVPRTDALLTDWGIGYTIQTYAGRPTFTDGHLELADNRRRIQDRSRALLAADDSELATLARRHGIRYVLLNAQWRWLPFVYMGRAGGDVLRGDAISLPPDVRETTLYRLFEALDTSGSFVDVYRVGPWLLLRVE